MYRNSSLHKICEIVKIKEVQNLKARLALRTSAMQRSRALEDKHNTLKQNAIVQANWQTYLTELEIVPEHIQYWSQQVNFHDDLCRKADHRVRLAQSDYVSKSETWTTTHLGLLRVKKFRKKIERTAHRKSSSRAINELEDRNALIWWLKR